MKILHIFSPPLVSSSPFLPPPQAFTPLLPVSVGCAYELEDIGQQTTLETSPLYVVVFVSLSEVFGSLYEISVFAFDHTKLLFLQVTHCPMLAILCSILNTPLYTPHRWRVAISRLATQSAGRG